MTNTTKSLIVLFKNPIRQHEISLFRGAILNTVKDDQTNILFHNHLSEGGLRYAYPLIQYKRVGGCAAIICIGEGAESIGKFFASCNMHVNIGDQEVELSINDVKANQTRVQVWNDSFCYHLRKWLPFSSENYQEYLQKESLAEKYAMLEKILVGNLLSFGKGVGVIFDKQVACHITQMEEPQLHTYKGVRMMSFDLEFKSNVSLPDFIGLGKGVSLGFGMVTKKKEQKENN